MQNKYTSLMEMSVSGIELGGSGEDDKGIQKVRADNAERNISRCLNSIFGLT